jgi:hypothetical protein
MNVHAHSAIDDLELWGKRRYHSSFPFAIAPSNAGVSAIIDGEVLHVPKEKVMVFPGNKEVRLSTSLSGSRILYIQPSGAIDLTLQASLGGIPIAYTLDDLPTWLDHFKRHIGWVTRHYLPN